MPALPHTSVPFRSPSGAVVAHVALTPMRKAVSDDTAPLVDMGEEDAREHGETTIQLRESERYEYRVESISDSSADLRLRLGLKLATRWPSLRDAGRPDAGLIETRSFCGTLLLELVEGEDLSQRIAHHHVPRDDAGRDDPGHRRVYVAGAGARQGCGQARGHLGVWRGAVRDAGGAPPVRRRGPDRSARRSCSS